MIHLLINYKWQKNISSRFSSIFWSFLFRISRKSWRRQFLRCFMEYEYDAISKFKSSTTHWCVLPVVKWLTFYIRLAFIVCKVLIYSEHVFNMDLYILKTSLVEDMFSSLVKSVYAGGKWCWCPVKLFSSNNVM